MSSLEPDLPSGLRRVASDVDSARLVTNAVFHRNDLVNVFIFAARAEAGQTEVARTAANANLAYSLNQCVAAIEQRVGCGDFQGSVITQFLRRQDWARHEACRDLWNRYLAAGLIQVDELVPFQAAVRLNLGSSGLIHPLEAAVLNGNLDSLRALMEAGVDESLVPTRDWGLSDPAAQNRARIEDIHGFIWAKAPNPALAPLMSAIVAEVAMTRRIVVVESAAHLAPRTPARHRQRRV